MDKITSKVQNCHLDIEDAEEPLFFGVDKAVVLNSKGETVFSGDLVIANLDGYAVVKREKFMELKEKAWRYEGLCK